MTLPCDSMLSRSESRTIIRLRLKLVVCQPSMPKIAVAKMPTSTQTCDSVNSITLPLSPCYCPKSSRPAESGGYATAP